MVRTISGGNGGPLPSHAGIISCPEITFGLIFKVGVGLQASIDKMLESLLDKGYKQEVGAYYWNQYVKDWQNHRESTKAKYNRRAAIEAFHGHLKQQMLLEKFMDARGLERAERHILMTYITILSVALCRLQHGITEGLSNAKCFN